MKKTLITMICTVLCMFVFTRPLFAVKYLYIDSRGHYHFKCSGGGLVGEAVVVFKDEGYLIKVGYNIQFIPRPKGDDSKRYPKPSRRKASELAIRGCEEGRSQAPE